MSTGPLDGWVRTTFTHDGTTREVFRRGAGPGIVVIHEIPGITPKVARFADDVVDAGFAVVMPSLVGTPGRELTMGYAAGSMLRVCISREFTTWALGRTSPIVAWLRALAAEQHERCGGPGVGAVGMCLTGGFALGMMVDERLVAPVLSQPSLPFPIGRRRAADLNLDPADLAAVKARAGAGCEVLGLRFDGDPLTGTRFETLRRELGDRFLGVELASSSRRDHSVLTEQRDDAAVTKVIDFFRAKLVRSP